MSQAPTPYNPNTPQPARNLAQLIANLGGQSQLAAHSSADPRALAAGIKPSFASLTFKGKTWGVRHRGQTLQLLARDPNTGAILGSIPTIDLVLVKSATAISKTFYMDKYKENDFKQPDCWSTNGIAPDMAAPLRQNATCRGCRWDAFGSRTMDDGRKGKACQDNKRLAVLPAHDLKNETYGGPMLLKLPPSSFNGLSELESALHMQGYAYFAVIMRLSFDHVAAFPKIIFTPIGVLNDHQMQEVLNWQTHDTVDRILSEEVVEVSGDPGQPAVETSTGQPTGEVVPFPQPVTTQHHPSGAQSDVAVPATAFQPMPPPPAHQPQPPAINVGAFGAASPSPPPQSVQQPSQPVVSKSASVPQGGEQVTETPEQKIARLEAALAAASAKPVVAKVPRKRSAPVTPNGQQPAMQVTPPATAQPGQPVPFTQQMTPPGAADDTPEGDEGDGDTPPDLDDRIDKLLK